jgi:hypothetical protein
MNDMFPTTSTVISLFLILNTEFVLFQYEGFIFIVRLLYFQHPGRRDFALWMLYQSHRTP